MITNKVGSPVTGDDFFGRVREQASCWECLRGDHLLLLAPRRVGKTSLMLRLRDQAPVQGFEACYMSGAEAPDEPAFVERLYEAAGKLPSCGNLWKRLEDGPAGKLLRRIQKVGVVGGFSFELAAAVDDRWAALGEKLAGALDQSEGSCLFLVDELPLFVLNLLRKDTTGERARRFLTWFRGLRQRSGGNGTMRWLLAGSIGLDTVASRLNLGDTINDLHIVHLGAFEPLEAEAMLEELAARYKFPLPEEVRDHALRRIGWPIPYYLQLVFSELHGCCRSGATASIDRVDLAFESLLRPSRKAYFDYWRQRLKDELGTPEAGYALDLLNAVAVDEKGASRTALSQRLSKSIPDAGPRQEMLHYLLDVLESDGYIVPEGRRFRFRSPLLREYWVRRVVP